jgi:signal transduction histidine kinase
LDISHGEYRTSWDHYDEQVVPTYFYLFTSFLLVVSLVPGRYARLSALENLARLDQKNAYIRYISHEIRTPLNAVSLGLQVLEKDLRGSLQEADKDRLETLVDASSACAAAIGILSDLLNYDKIEGGKMTLELKQVPAFDIISKALSLFAGQARHKGVELVADIVPMTVFVADLPSSVAAQSGPPSSSGNNMGLPATTTGNNSGRGEAISRGSPDLGLTSAVSVSHLTGSRFGEDDLLSAMTYLSCKDLVNADDVKLGQVLNNLISNAIKFTPEGGKITIRARKRRENLRSKPKPLSSSAHGLLSSGSIHGMRRARSVSALGPEAPDAGTTGNATDLSTSVHGRARPYIASPQQEYLVIEVVDSGVGISAEDQKKMFSEYAQFNPNELQVCHYVQLATYIVG